MKNQLKAGAILSYINLGLSTLIPLFYTPVMLRLLGESEYGLYSLSHSVIAYLSLLSFGFGSTIVRYIALYRGSGDKQQLEKAFGFFLGLYCSIALLVIVVGSGLSLNVENIFHRGLTDSEIGKMRILMLIMTFNSALSFPVSVFTSVVLAHERYIFRKLVDMITTVIVPLSNIILLYLGYGSVGMACTSTAIQLIVLPLNVFYCMRILHVRPVFKRLKGSLMREMVGFSAFVFIASLVDMLFWSTDKVILGMLAGSTAVAVYNIGSTFNSMVISLSAAISGVLTPRVTNMIAADTDTSVLSDLFIKVGRIQFVIVALMVSGFTVFGRAFVLLWAGEAYKDAYWIAIMTLFPLCVPLIQNTGLSIVTAQNKHQFRSIVYLIIAIINVASTYMLVPTLGGIGAALCSCVSYIIGQGFIMNIYYYRVTHIDIPLFWKNILQMSVVPGIMLILGLLLVKKVSFNNWISFFLGVASYTLIYCVSMYLLAMNTYEKNLFIVPLRKIISKVKK